MFQIPDPKEQLVAIMKRIYAQGMKMETYISRRAEPTRAV